MSTRSERFRFNEERKRARIRTRASATGVKRVATVQPKQRVDRPPRKAIDALEVSAPGRRPSRKLTRASANRAKRDSTLTLVESLVKGSPEARYRRASPRNKRVRGSAG